MHIYQAEKDAGLSEVLSAKSSIVYASALEKSTTETAHKMIRKADKALAGIEDTDLYYTQSILVTTSWNKNDDIFDAKEVWLARNTPTHKPTNLEHDEKNIVGHITSNWIMGDEGDILEDGLDEDHLPNKFHIITGSVIYKGYTEPELKERTDKLIAEIENGTKYVSMECFFKGFDYGLVNKATGRYTILPRNEETAFLTKHLRAYGGLGEHENYKIGRVLRQITFSGKGFVNKPANPESIIFSKDSLPVEETQATIKKMIEKNANLEEEGVFSNQANLKENIMSVDPVVPEQTEVVEPVVEAAVETTPVEVSEEAEAAKKMKEEMEKKEEEMKKMKAALEAAQAELAATNEVLAGYKSQEQDMLKKEKLAKRKASLVEGGLEDSVASEAVASFESLDDATFDNIVALVAALKKSKKEEEEKPVVKAEETAAPTEDLSVALENVETNDQEIDLSVGSEAASEVQSTRAALVDFVCIRLGKKLNKGE